MIRLLLIAAFALSIKTSLAADEMHEGAVHVVQAERLEYQAEDESWLWDLQGWSGYDRDKFWWKTEGTEDHAELQMLYSRAISPYFDVQFGLRHDFEPDPQRSFAVIGLQGLAPQWFEIDSALFISDGGKVSLRFEAEYEMLLTQKLVLQPRLELDLGASEEPEYGQGSGLRELEFGLRLRYEIHRKFAPYVGVEWNAVYGDTADFAVSAGEDSHAVTAVAGLRAWF
jgi:copper resistance protein B